MKKAIKANTKEKKPNIFVRMGRKLKEVFSELKRVSWPTFGKVVKATGAVLLVVSVFALLFTGLNAGLQALWELLVKTIQPK